MKRSVTTISGGTDKGLSTTQVIVLGFLLAIAVGTALLCLPWARAGEGSAPFVTALFTATTSVCVTGLTVVNTFSYWSVFGQVIILLLIQLGGLGVIAFSTSIMLIIGRRVTLRDRLLLESAFNLNTLSGLVQFLLRMLKGTFVVEFIGFLCYLPVMVREFGAAGVWKALFLSISAFCNAGLDIIGPNSLMPYVCNAWVSIVTVTLIVLGGLGFIVWWDAIRVARLGIKEKLPVRQCLHRMNLHSKLVIVTTFILIVAGMLLVLLFEYSNPETLGELPFFGKLLASLFQSVTLRTAGFVTISQKGLYGSTALVCMLLMFIGGSTCGTAGGVKTNTVALLALSAAATAKGSEKVTAFRRSIPLQTVRRAMSVVLISFAVVIIAAAALGMVGGGDFVDAAFETFSAVSTAGVSRDYTQSLGVGGQLIVILCMYLGRIGPVSLAVAFSAGGKGAYEPLYPSEDVSVG